jgi:GH25 family lysozyme M1 (1,4-beta-N-acetylmuramidase)
VYLLVCAVLFVLLGSIQRNGFVEATLGIDVSSPISESTFRCLKNNGYHYVIVRGYQSNGHPDPNCRATVANARNAGMSKVDVYMFPCPQCSLSAATQVRQAVDALKGSHYDMFWFDIEGPQYWRSQSFNREFMAELLSTAHGLGQKIGIYTSASQWIPIMGDWTGGKHYPLWYAHYDDNPSFSDFRPFGGWSKPDMKQYVGDATVCGADIDKDWHP